MTKSYLYPPTPPEEIEQRQREEIELIEMMSQQPTVRVRELKHSITLTVRYKKHTGHFWAMTLERARHKADLWLAELGYTEGL